ncbi:site-specific DNA-methyltransferase [Insulibacter thermoxylanivorax]|uniref:Site-specific DNA-methyltransferase n=1 Tax=Insulibacter thermoxylanivorax TaxID=2749268 RepID=A0A916QF89_9BACL|nr:site-specific DNA-methyltransferase [Insulibacter thermoxylanivorax]GFR37317.1 site-specific DNA-methyltransferase [Insulibacter thermoxylanivorax]
MKKLTMKSVDLTQVNIDKIAELFPNVITEARDEQGKIKRAVDFDLLKQELSDVLVEGEKERYQLTWPGKKQAILNANTPIEKTLRPVKEDSVDWDNTQNLYIEGDNLEVLKLLQESYLNKIKCIYIDPPYNTGKDFVYKDDFRESAEEYLEETGQIDEQGNRLFQNTESNGRFHSDWLTMMYSRLKIARQLLKEDGVIFISIDDNEIDNIKKLCDEVFGASNFVGIFVWKRRTGANDSKRFFVSNDQEYIISYAKTEAFVFKGIIKSTENYQNPDNDPRGPWARDNLTCNKTASERPNLFYPITDPNTGITYQCNPNRVWVYEKARMERLIMEGKVLFPPSGNGTPMYKRHLSELRSNKKPLSTWILPSNLSDGEDNNSTLIFPLNFVATKELRDLLDGQYFDYPKSVQMLYGILNQAVEDKSDDIVLDFFSGSATTAHAVMQLNADDGGNRKFIMVQLPEPTSENSEAYKAGYKNICEIGKERIRRAAKKIKEETGADIDYGFRVFRVDSSNMKDVYYAPDKLKQGELFDLASNIKEDRTGEDLLIQVMLELGLELSLPMETKQLEGKTVHYVAGNSLIACFDDNVPESVIKQIAAEQPLRVVFRDSSFEDDSSRINVEELFKMLSPGTEIQVL